MKKYMLGILAVGCALALCSCSAEKKQEGTFTYDYFEIPEMEMLDSFTYDGHFMWPGKVTKKKTIFNMDAVKADFFTGENSYLLREESYLNSWDSGDYCDDYTEASSYSWNPSTRMRLADGFDEAVLANKERYLSEDYLSDLKKLDSSEMTIEEFVDIYGVKYASWIEIMDYFKADVDINRVYGDVDPSSAKDVWDMLFGYEKSLEKINSAKKNMKNFNIELHVISTVKLETYEDFEEYVNSDSKDRQYKAMLYENDGSELLFPAEYSNAHSKYYFYMNEKLHS